MTSIYFFSPTVSEPGCSLNRFLFTSRLLMYLVVLKISDTFLYKFSFYFLDLVFVIITKIPTV